VKKTSSNRTALAELRGDRVWNGDKLERFRQQNQHGRGKRRAVEAAGAATITSVMMKTDSSRPNATGSIASGNRRKACQPPPRRRRKK